jgi:hypothetical protein
VTAKKLDHNKDKIEDQNLSIECIMTTMMESIRNGIERGTGIRDSMLYRRN